MFGLIDHIGIAVADLEASIELYSQTFAMPLVHREVLESHGVEAVLFDVGANHVELLAPLGPDTTIGKFLRARGPGLHHVAYRVTDIARSLRELEEQGLRLLDREPRSGIRNSLVGFVHPASAGGVLVELVQPATDH